MRNQYRAGPIYRAGLIVSGGMCAGLGIAILVALALHRAVYAQLLMPQSTPPPAASAIGFATCGLALIGVGCWFPRVTAVMAMVTLSMAVALVAERVLGTGPRVETMIAANLRAEDWNAMAPNTMIVLLLGAVALLVRHNYRWYESRLWIIGVLGSIIFAIGIVGCMGYMTGAPSYTWQSRAPMSFVSAICSGVLGLGIVMSACRFSELDDAGVPRWFGLVVFTGAMAVNLATAVAYLCNDGRSWKPWEMMGLLPMTMVCGALSLAAVRELRRQAS